MFAIELTLLTGRYVATAYNDRAAAEWPPHPARLFSALVATHCSELDPSSDERRAMEWLEQQAPPTIAASEASEREVVTVFVPVNDTTVIGTFDGPRERVEQARFELDTVRDELLAANETGADKKAIQVLQKRCKKAETALDLAEKALRDQLAKAVLGKENASTAEMKTAEAMFPERRGRQPRTFPSVTPENPVVVFHWPAAHPTAEDRSALETLCGRVVRVGHSSSLVRLRVVDAVPEARWAPDELGTRRLRVPLPGQLCRLESLFALHQESQPRVLPARFEGYRECLETTTPALVRSLFEDDWLILKLLASDRSGLPILSTAAVAEAVRGALQKHGADPVPELISGHAPDGSMSQRGHLAIVPIPSVAHPHADGHLLGVALVLPREAGRDERLAVYRALDAWESDSRDDEDDSDCPPVRLLLGPAGAWQLQRIDDVPPSVSLRSATWCAFPDGARVWMSATPVALDRNPGDLTSRDPRKAAAAFTEAEVTIANACERIGLPRPEHVSVTLSAPLAGSEKTRRFPPFPGRAGKTQRVLVHASLRFGCPVMGPVLLGAGRYRGLGLFRPMRVTLSTRSELDARHQVERAMRATTGSAETP